MAGNGITSTGTISSGAITTSNVIKVDAGHGTARMQLLYSPTSDTNKGTLTAWVSEPGLTYSDAGIGANIHVSGQYYGRQINSGYGVYARFRKSTGAFEVWNTQATSGSNGGQGTQRLDLNTGNIGQYALPISGGTITGNITAVNGTFTGGVYLGGTGAAQ